MPTGKIEHANLSVTQPERSAALLTKLLGWEERWRGNSALGGDTIHIGEAGNGATYLALYTNDEVTGDFAKGAPLNHIGLLVDDLDAAESVVIDAGLKTFSHDDYDPGRRFYFFDWDGIEFEVVSYSGGEA
ncbi:VOC family protein [Erythrobacter rubeus]|uniref:VOC family protein n=1 Tax=Erythrobacter rubeus TaxID=2760803 RepID=A0ABR8KT46_9SPHN|nr:VOC family protein [Erythrobacter rubeus]MBD2842268.1 VOC family protein [Erythrobacter rubeus]